MERIIKISLILLIVFSYNYANSIELQKAEYLVDEASVEGLFDFNGNLFVTNNSDSNKLYTRVNENWELSELYFISDFKQINNFIHSGNIIYFTGGSDGYLSLDSGKNWDSTHYLNNPIIVENNILGSYSMKLEDGFYKHKILASLDIKSNELRIATFDNNGVLDTIFTNCLAKSGQYIISGDIQSPGSNTPGGLYISSDKGANWSKLNNFNHNVVSLTFHNDIIFVGTTDKYLYKSIDLGETWELVDEQIMPTNLLYSNGDQLFANIADVYNDDTLSYGLLLSIDNGITWTKVHNGIDRTDIKEFMVFNSDYYVITDKNRLFETNDIYSKWRMSPIFETDFPASDLIKYKDTLYTTSGLRCIQFSTDNGNIWNKYSQELNSKYYISTEIVKENETIIAVGQDNFSFCISKDNGSTWEFNNGDILSIDRWLHDIELVEDRIILATKFGTRYSDDFGNSWVNIEGGGLDSTVESFLITYDYEKEIYLITSNGLFKSEDLGNNWELLNKLDNFNPIINFYSINESLYFYTNKNEIYISSNGGKNWELLNNQPIQKDRNLNFYIKSGNFFVTAYDYLYVSTDEGNNWEEYYIGDKTKFFFKIEISGEFLVCTSRDGIFRIKLTDIGITPTSVETERNYLYTLPPYPLPSQNEVKVQFYWDINLPMTVDDISIYDLNGSEIQTKDKLQINKQASHYGNLTWDCSNEQAGIYIINISHGTEERAVKVVVE